MKLTSKLIHAFSAGLLSQRYDDPQPTPEFHKEVWDYCCLEDDQVAIAAPRGHAKSTAVTHAFTLAAALFRVHDHIMILSDTETQAISFLGDIKVELMENDELRQLFHVVRLVKDNEKEIIVELGPDRHFFRIFAKSSMQSLRGLKWRGKRPNLILGDDLENDEIVLNPERREKFRNWFLNALLPSLAKDGKIRVVGTILHFDSLLERLMPATTGENSKYTVHEPLKDYSTDPNKDWVSVKYRGHPDMDNFSELLWPAMWTEARYRKVRNNYLRQGNPEGYAQEYLNNPIDESTAYFRKEDFIELKDIDIVTPGTYYAAIDFAISQAQRADYSVIVVGKLDHRNQLHIVDVRRGRWDSKDIIEEMFSVQVRYNPDLFIAESGTIEKSLGPFLSDEMFKRNVFMNLHKVKPVSDKRTRARAIQGRMRQGGVCFDKKASWYLELEQEMLRFDRGQHDDQVDAMAWLGLVLNQMVQGPSDYEMIDEEQEYIERQLDSFEMGRSATTGY